MEARLEPADRSGAVLRGRDERLAEMADAAAAEDGDWREEESVVGSSPDAISPDMNAAPPTASDQPAPECLPALDELVLRIPGEARGLLDELFRAKFVAVRRIPEQLIKPDASGAAN